MRAGIHISKEGFWKHSVIIVTSVSEYRIVTSAMATTMGRNKPDDFLQSVACCKMIFARLWLSSQDQDIAQATGNAL